MKTLLLSTFLLVLFSCSQDPSEKEYNSTIVATDETEATRDSELQQTKLEEQDRQSNLTSISFDRLIHDYGKIKSNSDNTTLFKIKNIGKKPLMIYNVKASCGCTIPSWNTHPIAPGKSDVIKVTFHPKPEQLNQITKTITVETNTDPGMTVLQIKAFVEPNKIE